MVFLAKTVSSTEWKAVANTISSLVEEATFDAAAEGIAFRAMDPSHVALVDLAWPNSAFEKYDCDKQYKFTVRVEDFVKLIKRAETKDAIEVAAAEEGMLAIRIADGYRREYKIHLIESTYSPTPLPKIPFKARFLVAEPTFEKILSDISVVSDHLTIETPKSKVVFTGKSDAGAVTVTLDKSNQDLMELEVQEESKATYSISYLLSIAKAAGSASDITLFEYSSKMPLKLEFKLSSTGGKIQFYLAPRIEER